MKANKTIYSLYLSDQRDRSKKQLAFFRIGDNWRLLNRRDRERRRKVRKTLSKVKSLSAVDAYRVAIIYQHGSAVTDSKKAIALARQSMNLGYEKAKLLFASATDRLLIKYGLKQKYGTQRIFRNGKWKLYPIDSTTTDKKAG